MKTCPHCGEQKELDQFGVTRRRVASGWKRVHYSYCKPCRVTVNTADKRKHTARSRRNQLTSKLRRNYGITPDQRELQRQAQDGKCAICRTDLAALSPQSVHIDHCHATGKLRGILCGPCNTGLGAFKDNPVLIRAAARYVDLAGIWRAG